MMEGLEHLPGDATTYVIGALVLLVILPMLARIVFYSMPSKETLRLTFEEIRGSITRVETKMSTIEATLRDDHVHRKDYENLLQNVEIVREKIARLETRMNHADRQH
jgi:hypothetical protein